MVDNRVKDVIDRALCDVGLVLGNQADVAYYCPFCKHRKRKLQINLDSGSSNFGNYNCWVCKHSNGTSGTNLISLLKKLGVDSKYLTELKSLLKAKKLGNFDKIMTKVEDSAVNTFHQLPPEFRSLNKDWKTPEYKNALHYLLHKRKLTKQDILRYNIGYCETGEYKHKVIIPSYDSDGNINFFTGRSYYETEYGKHKNPSWSKDIIGFELYIDFTQPIILVEGAFDAIAVKRNAIPLFGKSISNSLIKKIIQEKVTDVYLALDADAIRDLIQIAEMLMGYGVNTYIVEIKDKDPSDCGFKKFMNTIHNISSKTDLKDLVKYRLGLKNGN